MLYLSNKHNPLKNSSLIDRFSHYKPKLNSAIKETIEIHQRLLKQSDIVPRSEPKPSTFSYMKKLGSALVRLSCLATKTDANISEYKTLIENDEMLGSPEWKKNLDKEYQALSNQIKRVVNLTDFGAIGDGITDNTEAFKKAIGNGQVKVLVPEGVFITKGIRLPSWTCLIGFGKGKSIVKLSDCSSKGTRLVTNSNHWLGNHHILVEGLSLDWNVERLGDVAKTCTWGNHSSCLTFANVTFGWMKNVEAINAGLHGFDVSASFYDYSGDGNKARGSSRFIWLDQLNAYGFGDDGITTHHSENIFISNCHLSDPSGRAHKKGVSNSNGIEVDDGSRNVWLKNNSTTRCFGGVEVKAHHNSSAGNNVHILGHLSVNDNRSYNFRHIGHHKNTDPNSKTAYHIQATNIISIAPVFTDLYEGSTPRGMVISAYVHVAVNHFTLIGDPNYPYRNNPVIAIQYKARSIWFKNVYIRDFQTASTDIRIYGGEQHADQITLQNIKVEHSSPVAIDIGKNVTDVSIHTLKALSKNGKFGIKSDKKSLKYTELEIKGYSPPIKIKS
ncbi:glycosyl hydrolase family 28-related protein [Mesobacillus maritimus]|uniref:glycosyl hydrolase family 28-related protein n=1 Tax=Mesobacillus maritimus TaxID=1643336 RepID=UPI00384F4B98